MHKGDIPDGLEINHKNGIKDDNRLENLEVVTHLANIRHAYSIGLRPKPQRGEKCNNSKLTWEDVEDIRERHIPRKKGIGTGNSTGELSREFGVHPSTIQSIVRGDTWKPEWKEDKDD